MRQWQQRAALRCDLHVLQGFERGVLAYRCAHHDVVLLTVRRLEGAGGQSRHRQPHGAIQLHRGHAQHAKFLRIDLQLEVGARHPQRIGDVARAGRGLDQPAHPLRQSVEHGEIAALHPHGNRRGNRNAIGELAHGNTRAGICIKAAPQRIQHPRCVARLVALQLHEQLGEVGRVVAHDLVVVDLRVAVAQVGKIAAHLAHARQLALHKAQRPVRGGQAGAIGSLNRDQEFGRIGLGEQAHTQESANHHDQQQ